MKVLLTTIAAAMMSTSAYAACSDIPNPTRFNPVELSEYQECWLDEYKADVNAGILGSLAWVRLDSQYFSAPISLIAKSKGEGWAEKFFDAISHDLENYQLSQIRDEARVMRERIIEILIDGGTYTDEEYLALREQKQALDVALAAEEADHAATALLLAQASEALVEGYATIQSLQDANITLESQLQYKIDEVETLKAQVTHYFNYSQNLQAQVAGNLAEIADLKARLHTAIVLNHNYRAQIEGNVAEIAALKVSLDAHKAMVKSLQAQVKTINNTTYLTEQHAYDAGEANGYQNALDNVFTNDATLVVSGGSVYYQHAVSQTNILSWAFVLDGIIVDTPSKSTITVPAFATPEFNDDEVYNSTQMSDGVDVFGILDNNLDFDDITDTLVDELESILEDSFNHGYGEGYEDGYKDGYVDGWNDAVDSIAGN